MDEVTGRTVMEDDNVVSIPLLSLPNLLLVPGQTLPMHFFNPQVTISHHSAGPYTGIFNWGGSGLSLGGIMREFQWILIIKTNR